MGGTGVCEASVPPETVCTARERPGLFGLVLLHRGFAAA